MNWQDFFTDNQIEWVSRGPNTARGEISIKCPWCGDEDPSQHLGVNLSTGRWGCLRNPDHRGHSTTYLIGYLLGCSQHQARIIADQYSRSDPEQLGELSLDDSTRQAAVAIEVPPNMHAISNTGSTSKFWNYLQVRGFDPDAAIRQYKLTCCLLGEFKDRLIIPMYRYSTWFAWTGRALGTPISAPRYLSSKRVKETIFGEDDLMEGGRLLFITEGPFDAMKLDHYGRDQGARATCGFGVSLSMEQIVLLNSRRNRFKKTVILFDRDAVEPAFIAKDWLPSSTVTVGQLPEEVKDPGEMNKEQIQGMINEQLYPNGAIKGKEKFEEVLDKRKGDLYLVNDRQQVFRIRMNPETKARRLKTQTEWVVENAPSSVFHLRINPNSDYIESSVTNGYIFSNFWHAWAYVNHLEQSGFSVDWNLAVGVG